MSQSAPHHTLASRLAAKRDLLSEAARQYAYGTISQSELEEAAVDFTFALEQKAVEHLKGGGT